MLLMGYSISPLNNIIELVSFIILRRLKTYILSNQIPNTGSRNTEGYVEIQNHDVNSHVSFKNIRIREKRY